MWRRRRTALNLTLFPEMSHDHLLCLLAISCFLDPPNVQGAILPVEAAYSAHVVSVIGEFVTGEAVLGAVGQVQGGIRNRVAIFTLPAIGTATAGEEKTC